MKRRSFKYLAGRTRSRIASLYESWDGAEGELDRRVHEYYLACAQRILPLLPDEWSRRGLEITRRRLDSSVSEEEVATADYFVEGAALAFTYAPDDEQVRRWCDGVASLTNAELAAMLQVGEVRDRDIRERLEELELEPINLLEIAAYFAEYVMGYPPLDNKRPPYGSDIFLSEQLLLSSFPELSRDATPPN